jgi:serine/threonine-protein kinase
MTDPLSRLNTALQGRYRIERELGEGGMATVYLADDLKHDRKVALKVLKPELAAVVGAERFLAEIKTTANLQHPHILPLFDSGEADGFLFYVMPYVEGETLRGRIDRVKQLPVEEAVRLARAVASALAYAHRREIIHRDIKPANILLHEGEPQVADFGIALAVSAAGGSRLTETGLSLGTPYYMSPEQASADRELGPQSDVYSVGCVLYEMLVGEPPHTGKTAQSVLAKILTEDPRSVTEMRRTVPESVAAVVAKALERLPADRFESAEQFVQALDDPTYSYASRATGATPPVRGSQSEQTGSPSGRVRALAGVTLLSLVLAALGWLRPSRTGAPAVYDMALPVGQNVSLMEARGFTVAPSGDFVVYHAQTESGVELWYRSLRDDATRRISADAPIGPILLSPDETRIAYATDGELKTVPVGGGPSTTISDVNAPHLGEWRDNGEIVLPDNDGRLLRYIDAGGGELRTVDIPYCVNATLLDDDERILCGGGGIKFGFVVDLSGSGDQSLLSYPSPGGEAGTPLRGSDLRLIDERYLVYVSTEGDLRATTVDLESLTVGRSVTLLAGVATTSYAGQGQFDIAGDGTLVYVPGPSANRGRLVKVDSDGLTQDLPVPEAAYLRFDVSPDGRRLASAVDGLNGQELKIYDLVTGREQTWLSTMTLGHPRWSPDGSEIVVAATTAPGELQESLLRGSPDATAPPDTISPVGVDVGAFLHDSLLVGTTNIGGGGVTIVMDLRTDPATADTLPATSVFAPDLSPDGRWITYGHEGEPGVRLEPFPARDVGWLAGGELFGNDAQWLSDDVFTSYDYLTREWYRVTIDESLDPPFSEPEFWFQDELYADTPGASHVATPDGGVIYMRATTPKSSPFFRVIPGWVDQMKAAVDEANRQ